MKNQTIKLTESRLRKLVEACVREALEETLDEGIGMEVIKNQINDPDNGEYTTSWDDFKAFTKGKPNKDEYRKSMDLYKAAKDGNIYSDNGKHKTDPYYHAASALGAKPGLGGKMHRAATYAGMAAVNGGKKAVDKVKGTFKGRKNN